ncbi:MAG: 4-hydroxy-tetrahydrodipicolinate reductase [Clostridiales bacterium]|nr:4-hydroxy-tetrahydrodipicolinate reductase [Clostridiales bacterium]
MTNVLIHGALGRMGRKVFEAATTDDGVKAVCGVDKVSDLSNPNFPIYDGFTGVTEKVDVIIDFSSPVCLDSILEYALKTSIPLVLCTTGYDDSDLAKIKDASNSIAIFRSANMSLGVNVLIDLVKKAVKSLDGFDIEIIEKHHNQKVDSPSGTALMLADAVKEELPEVNYVYGREGKVGKRTKTEVGIHAVRGGNIVGDHDVLFAGLNETVTLSHQAFDRSVFAVGAVKAAKYIATKKSGIFNMQDLVSEK